MIKKHTIGDRISFRSSLVPLKQPSFQIISALQDSPADVQIESLALTFVLICEAADLRPHDLITRALKQAETAEGTHNPHLEAIRDYAAGEIK